MSALAADPADITPDGAPDPAQAPAPKPAADTLLGADVADPAPANPSADPAAEAPAKTEDAPKGMWPDDWREQLAGGDEAFLRQLKRYASPTTFAKGFLERENLIRSGKLKRDMPEGGDEKALAEWRKEQGIPDKPENYKAPQIKGYEWADEDKAVMAGFFEHAHAKGLPQSAVDGALEWYASYQQEQMERLHELDTRAMSAAEDKLRLEFGPEYRANMRLAQEYLDQLPIPRTDLMNARLPDGTRLGDNPAFALWAVDQARAVFGDGGFLAGDAQTKSTSRLAELDNMMKTDIDGYFRGGHDKEHRELMAQQMQAASRRR